MENRPSILLSSGCLFHLPLREIASLAAEAGFDGLEVIVSHPRIAPGEEMSAVHEICPVRSLHAPFRQWNLWGGHLRSWQATVELANALEGCNHVTLHPPGTSVADTIRARWFAKATDLRELLDALGRVELSLENLPWEPPSPFSRDPLEHLLEQCAKRNIGMTLDVCHLGVSGRDVLAALERVPVEMIRNVHYSDARGHREHLAPGKGGLPLDEFLRRLRAKGYMRTLTLELEPAAFPDDRGDVLCLLREHRERIAAILH